jgi:hypothetical protein
MRVNMDPNQDILLSLCPGPLPQEINKVAIPSTYHCVGTDKLIGQYYGRAIFEDIQCNDSKAQTKVSILSAVIRAFIVIDDFIKDNNIQISKDHVLHRWLKNMESYSIEIIGQLSDSPEEVWGNYYLEYENAFFHFDNSNIYSSIIKKCFLIYLPFSLEIIVSNKQSKETYDFMKNYLFALQLLDDFQDMDEDIVAPKNHNIFLSCISTAEIENIIKNKNIIAPYLLFYIKENFQCFQKKIKSKTIIRFINKNIEWLDSQLVNMELNKKQNLFVGPFNRFSFDNALAKISKSISNKKNTSINVFNEIKAENMHTILA